MDSDGNDYINTAFPRHEPDDDVLELPHEKQVNDLLAWHIGLLNLRWYVKPRSTCWFEEYLFNIYTPDMFYDILRMRRGTFERLVYDMRLHIQRQHTHWRQPIGQEKKVVVALFKLMHGVPIPLVADKAALGKSTVHGILRQVCSAISNNFGHLIAWPVGRRLARVTAAFQTKQWFPNCIGAIDGSHVYIATPPNNIVAANHRNRHKSCFPYSCKELWIASAISHPLTLASPTPSTTRLTSSPRSYTARWRRGNGRLPR